MKYPIKNLVLCSILFASSLLAAPPPKYLDVDVNWQQTQTLPALSIQQGASMQLRIRPKTNGRRLTLTGLTARYEARATATNTSAYTASSNLTSNEAHFIQMELDNTQTGTAFTDWVYSIILIDGADEYPIGIGAVNVVASDFAGSSGVLTGSGYQTNGTAASPVSTLNLGSGISSSLTAGTLTLTVASSAGGDMLGANNLSDVSSAATSRTNLGLGTAATNNTGDFLQEGDSLTATDLTGIVPLASLSNIGTAQVSVAANALYTSAGTTYTGGTNIDVNGTIINLDAAAVASDDLADSALQNVVEDTTPQLGGNLDANGGAITNLGAGVGGQGLGWQGGSLYTFPTNYELRNNNGVRWVQANELGTFFYGTNTTQIVDFSNMPILEDSNGIPLSQGTATTGDQIVNYQTATNLIALLSPAGGTYTGGTNIDVNGTTINLDAAAVASDALADSATQPADSVTTLDGTANRLLWVNGSGDVAEIALGTSGEVLTAAGTTSVPTWDTPSAGGGDTFPAWTDYSKNAISTTVSLTTSTWTDLALVKPLGGDSTTFNADGSFTFSGTGVFDVVSTAYFTAIDSAKSASLGLELNGDSATRIRGFLYRSQAAAGVSMSGTAFMGYNDNATNKWRIVVWSNSSAGNVITSDELTHTSVRRWKNAGE